MTCKRELFNFIFFAFLIIGAVLAASTRANARDEESESDDSR